MCLIRQKNHPVNSYELTSHCPKHSSVSASVGCFGYFLSMPHRNDCGLEAGAGTMAGLLRNLSGCE